MGFRISQTFTDRQAQFVRFVMAGLANTAFGYAVFAALLFSGLPPGAALLLATILGVAFNFQTSRHLVFRSAHAGHVVWFIGVYGAIFMVNWVALLALQSLGLPAWAGQAVLAVPCALLSFTAQRRLVFPTCGEI